MTAAFNPTYAEPHRQAAFDAPVANAAPVVPVGTFAPGTKVQVGGHRVVIEKYLSEGGFAHVYLVRLPKAVNGEDGAVLKRVAVPDKESLASMRTEVETMKKLKGRLPIVTYIDSHASQLKGGGYEVFLLMEYCNGGGLIDFMNTRLQNRLTEPEILKIFSDVALGVACMHYLKPPLLHRDLKVENVLISSSGSSRRYKLCDFGSTAPPRPAATSAVEGRLIEDDVQKHTTLQYRSPEMIDVYRKQPIDEKSDIWALGVLLYKLCYYKTPFEEQGQMAILNASFKFPAYPSFSDKLKKLIASMLRENPQVRPNIYQVLREACLMRGTEVPIKDIYAGRTASEARRNQQLPLPTGHMTSPQVVGAYNAPVVEEKPIIPDIVPMRRGRPIKVGADHKAPKPSPSPLRGQSGDPFVALDSSQVAVPSSSLVDEASTRFPPLDEFSLLHDSGSKFAFDKKSESVPKPARDISQRVTEALADDVFAQSKSSNIAFGTRSKPVPSIASSVANPKTSAGDVAEPKPTQYSSSQQESLQRPAMVSTGTMTSPTPLSHNVQTAVASSRPIFRFPRSPETRTSSLPKALDSPVLAAASLGADSANTKRSPRFLDHQFRSQISNFDVPRSPASSRPSLEGQRPSLADLDSTINRSRSTNSRQRPSSVHIESKMNFFKGRDPSRGDSSVEDQSGRSFDPEHLPSDLTGNSDFGTEPIKINSNVEFLRAMEEEVPTKRKEKRMSGGSRHVKRASMPAISLSSTKSLLAGRFGDAFRRFETNTSTSDQQPLSASPDRGRELTPIAGSEATDGRSDDGYAMEETEQIPPEMRRELERRRLSQEEKRVSDAAAAYRQRFTGNDGGNRGTPGGNNRATSIQSKVKSLLDETGRTSPVKSGGAYSRHIESLSLVQAGQRQDSNSPRSSSQQISRGPPSNGPVTTNTHPPFQKPITNARQHPSATPSERIHPGSIAPPAERLIPRPTAPPKPQALRTGERQAPSPAKPVSFARKPVAQQSSSVVDNALLANEADSWETNFSKKYPSLSGLEMVETEIDRGAAEGVGR